MKNQDLYARLELISPDIKTPTSADAAWLNRVWGQTQNRLSHIGQALFNYFLGSTEPRIVKKWDADGRAYFRVYDPIERTYQLFDSEQELRVWLDQRYYQ